MASSRSTSYLSLSQQSNTLSAKSAHSVANIMWLNETLQPFMTRDYILAPFGPLNDSKSTANHGNWTASTLKYSVDVNCETPIYWSSISRPMVNSTWGCHFLLPVPRVLADDRNATKLFDTLYVGYYNDDGLADYYLSPYCPPSESHSFLVQWSKTRDPLAFNGTFSPSAEQQRENSNTTTLYCRSSYHVQKVEATIRLTNNEVLAYKPVGAPQPIPNDLFNTSNFEAAMSQGHERFRARTDFPTTNWPSQTAFLVNMPLNLGYLPKMAPFAIGASQLPLDDYLDPKTLADSYQSAYRLLFARQLTTVLSSTLDMNAQGLGKLSYQTQSIILVPAFTYIVEGLLIAAILFATMIFYYSGTRVSKLQSDPATIVAVMSLAADDTTLIEKLRPLDQASEKDLEFCIRNRRFRLCPSQGSGLSHRLQILDLRGDDPLDAFNDELQAPKRQETMHNLRKMDKLNAGIVNGLQPTEFKAKMGLAFIATQVTLFVVIASLFVQIQKKNGLPLPSSNRFVRQLLENYLPTAIGTFIEPFWVVLNRHLCLLQPFDELRRGRKAGKKSLSLEYSSLPPQLAIVKALLHGNFLLGIVCTMALLANGLAVSLSGLFFENTVDFMTAATYFPQYRPQFRALDGETGSFIAAKGQALEPVYIGMSNSTAHTPLPPWTDTSFFYFPFLNSTTQDETWNHRALTSAIGVQLACQPISSASEYILTGTKPNQVPSSGTLTVSLTHDGGKQVTCIPRGVLQGSEAVYGATAGLSAYEFAYALDGVANSSAVDASFCREHVAAGWVRATLVDGVPFSDDSPLDSLPVVVASHDETIIICRSKLMAGTADILTSADGHVQSVYSRNISENAAQLLTPTPSDLLGQTHQILTNDMLLSEQSFRWRNDSFPGDFINYLIEQASNSSAHLDPTRPPPTAENIIPKFVALYSQLWATLIARNMDTLLKPVEDRTTMTGFTVRPTIRIFMSKPMFVVAETILMLYIVVTITLYLRRPWKILCRMPTTLASIIAFIAASHAVTEFRGTLSMTNKQLDKYLRDLDNRYGFGTFVGTDGKTHVGIEKYPFLAPLMKAKGALDRQDSGDSEASTLRDTWGSKFTRWKSGKVREGGWI
jgi:hypothetical protein